MTGLDAEAGITVFAGRFGSGKTEAAIAHAAALAGSKGAILIDLDIVTPYFRSREAAGLLRQKGVEVVAPAAIGQHLDTPAITPQILGAIQQTARPVVLDVGGDRQGARALGGFSLAISARGYAMFFVVNPYRPFTATLDGVAASIAEIEAGARLRVTALVSNPNLKGDTGPEQIAAGHDQIEAFAAALGLPIALVCLERRFAGLAESHFSARPTLILDRFLVQPWE